MIAELFGRTSRISRSRGWSSFVVGSLLIGIIEWTNGCSVLRMYDPVKVHFTDWVMYGGNVQRTHVAFQEIQLPLKQVWEYETGAGFGNCSPLVADSLIFLGTRQGELHVVRVGSGTRVGAVDLGSSIEGTPVVAGEFVYVPMSRNGANVMAFHLLRGGIEWRCETGDIETAPLMIDNRLYVATLRGELVCLDRFRGDVVWQYTIPSRKYRTSIRSSPAADLERIFFGADDGKLYAVAVKDGKFLWSFTAGKSIVSTPSVADNKVYVGANDGYVYCLNAETGVLVWRRRLNSALYASQAVTGGWVYVGAADGDLYCLNASTGEELWRFQTGSVISAPPLVSGELVFVGTLDKHLYALDAKTGKNRWKQEFSSRIKAPPVVWRNYLFVLLEDRRLVAFQSTGDTVL